MPEAIYCEKCRKKNGWGRSMNMPMFAKCEFCGEDADYVSNLAKKQIEQAREGKSSISQGEDS